VWSPAYSIFAKPYGDVEFVPVAITPEQASARALPSAPPKPTYRRGRHFSESKTWQAEALDSNELAQIIEEAIVGRLDYAAVAVETGNHGVPGFLLLGAHCTPGLDDTLAGRLASSTRRSRGCAMTITATRMRFTKARARSARSCGAWPASWICGRRGL
jgi:hypothetical protein